MHIIYNYRHIFEHYSPLVFLNYCYSIIYCRLSIIPVDEFYADSITF